MDILEAKAFVRAQEQKIAEAILRSMIELGKVGLTVRGITIDTVEMYTMGMTEPSFKFSGVNLEVPL